jgi:uncharacterized protein (UPF0305 family)
MDSIAYPRRDLAHFPDEALYIQHVCVRLRKSRTKGELGVSIAREITHFSMHDLQVIGGELNREVDRLPSPYREAVRPFFRAQIFGVHHTLLTMHRSGRFAGMREPIRDPDAFRKFCDIVTEGCFRGDGSTERNSLFFRPRHRLFYYLLAGFAMFVLDQPGHPVGTPFPGGFTVREKNGTFVCPVRDKEKGVTYAICNVCPAIQSEMER